MQTSIRWIDKKEWITYLKVRTSWKWNGLKGEKSLKDYHRVIIACCEGKWSTIRI